MNEMIKFHPDENVLVEYASGTLDRGIAIGVKAHLSMCTKCQQTVSQLNLVGASFLIPQETESHNKVDESASFASLMARIHKKETAYPSNQSNSMQQTDKIPSENNSIITTKAAIRKPVSGRDLPPIVQQLLPKTNKLRWKRISPSLKQANLQTGQNKYEICLHKIRRGGKVSEHDHGGKEVTIVLEGMFSDENGTYRAGDFIIKEPGERHRPTATQDQDCLCLSVVEAPVQLTGFVGTLINRFLPFNPA